MYLWDSLTGLPIASLVQVLALFLGCRIVFIAFPRSGTIAHTPLFSWLMLGWPLLDCAQILYGNYHALIWGRCGVNALMALACIGISSSIGLDSRINKLGLWSGIFLSTNVAIQALGGSPDALTGNANHTLAVCVPGLVGWTLQCTRKSFRSSLIPGLFLVLTVAWCWLAYVGILRRGALLALGVGIVAGYLYDLNQRRPLAAKSLTIISLSLLATWACWKFSSGISLDRNIRTLYWQSAWDGILTWWPYGGGPWAALHLPCLNSEPSRILLILGEPIDHTHNEPLSILLEYGLPGLILASLQVIALVRDLLKFIEPEYLIPRIGALASLGIFLLVDNAFSMPFGRISLGIITGILLTGKDALLPPVSINYVGKFRWAGLPLLGLGCIPFVMEVPVWVTPLRSSPATLLPGIQSTGLPQVASQLLELAALSPMPNMGGLGDPLTRTALDRFGPGDPFLDYRLQTLRFLGRTTLILAAKASKDAQAKSISDEWQRSHASILLQWPIIATKAIHYWPLKISAYEDVALLLASNQQFDISERLLTRTRRLMGDPKLFAPQLSLMPDNLDAAADLWAECRWWSLSKLSRPPELHQSLNRLAQHWGWAIRDPLPFLDTLDVDTEHARDWFPAQLNSVSQICLNADASLLESSLKRITHPASAKLVLPVLERISEKLTQCGSAGYPANSSRKLWLALDRIHALARVRN